MLFNNITCYRIEMPSDEHGTEYPLVYDRWLEEVREKAQAKSFRPLAEKQPKGAGWEQPYQDINNEYLVPVPDRKMFLLCLRIDERKVSSSAVKEELKKRIKKIETAEKRKVGKQEKSSMQDDIVAEYVPKTLPTPARIPVIFDLENMSILIGTSSDSQAGEIKRLVIDQLFPAYQAADDEIERPRLLVPVMCRGDARMEMLAWLRSYAQDEDGVPAGISLNRFVALERDKSKNIAVTGSDMDSPAVQDAINDDYVPFSLSVSIMSGDYVFATVTLDRDGSFKKITVPDEFKPKADDSEAEDAEYQQLLAEIFITSQAYHQVADVVRAAFGSGDKTAQVLAAALEGRNNMLQAMSAIGQVTVTDKGLVINADAID